MYPKLTYLLILIAFLVSSCNSDPSDDIIQNKGHELSFNVSNIPDLTRGSVTTSINQFVVYGDFKPVSSASDISTPIVMFNKTNVEYKNGSWCYDGIQYWIPDYEHSFVAVSPGSIFETGNTPRYLNSQLSFEYSIPASGNSEDILIATHRRLYADNESGAALDNRITFTFNHLLSLINIAPTFNDNLMDSNAYILIHKLEFSGIKTKTQFSIVPAQRQTNSQTDDMTVGFNPQAEGNIAIGFSTPIKIQNNAPNVNIFENDNAIIMLPQEFDPDSEAKLIIEYSINEDSDLKQGSILLKNQKWMSGKSYTYKFTIERIGLTFDSFEINPWNTIQEEEIKVD